MSKTLLFENIDEPGLNTIDVYRRRGGYDIAHLGAVIDAVTVPVIASGGAGAREHFRDAFAAGASGALAATVFHDRIIAIPDLKEYLATCGIEMRR